MRTTDFDAVAASAPLNREASTVRDGSGDLWEAKRRPEQARWDAPPLPERPRPATVADLAGLRAGRLTVVGYHTKKRNTGTQWLVRCDCGAYELRRTKALTEFAGTNENSCSACDYLQHLQWLERNERGGARRKADEQRLDALAADKGRGWA